MKKFKKVYIEITNVCNLSCSFCPGTTRKNRFMSLAEFEIVLKNISHLTDYLYFHIMGELLLHPELEGLLEIAEKYNKKVIITTNGTLISNKQAILLKSKAIYKVVFSLHSFEANNSTISLNNYLENILNFCKKASIETDIITALRLWNYDNDNLKGENKQNDKIIDIINKAFAVENFKLQDILSSRGFKLCERVYLQTAKKFEWPDINKNEITNKVFCYGLRDHFGIQADGTVVPCCLDNNGEIPLGNCFNENIDDILNCERAKNIYNGFSNRTACEDLCKRCDFVTKFSL